MPNRGQTQDQQRKKGKMNPDRFSPDDDEAQEGDQSHARPQDLDQGSGGRESDDDVEEQPQIEDEVAEDDEDEDDGIGAAR